MGEGDDPRVVQEFIVLPHVGEYDPPARPIANRGTPMAVRIVGFPRESGGYGCTVL